jgi:hypothetical protein
MTDNKPFVIRCPVCGHKVKGYFDHIAIDCAHDMSEKEIEALLAEEAELYGQPKQG